MARPPEADLPLFREKRVNDPEKALKLLRVDARGCTRCDLYKNATQTVFGEGDAGARIKWEPRGKRRLHKTPAQRELEACYPWLENEVQAIRPRIIVALGAIAAKALLGSAFRITRSRGRVQQREGLPDVIATFHPSFLLRLKGRSGEHEARRQFVADLRMASRYLTD